jgi:ubiquitin carboxyl-terminal hydrolase 7
MADYVIIEDVLWNAASSEDDYLGLDHVDRSRSLRNGVGDLFLR